MISVSGSFEASNATAVGATESHGERHAALVVYAMAPEDRTWVLDALTPAERALLLELLAELESLGIERDPALIEDATAGVVAWPKSAALAGAQGEPPMSDEAVLHALDSAQVQELVACLRTEPVGLIAVWVRLAEWPWREQMLNALEPGQRRRIEANLSATTLGFQVPPGMRAALISKMAARLRGRPLAAAPSMPRRKLKHSFYQVFHRALSRRSAGR